MTRKVAHVADQGVAMTDTASVQVKSHLWLTWAEIAIEREADARRARALLEDATSSAGWDIGSELKASMVGIAAVTHALDGFAGEVEGFAVPAGLRASWAANKTASRGPIIETLKHGFVVGREAGPWRQTLDSLYETLRNPALHHRPSFQATVPHPALPTNVGPEYADYVLENVAAAVTFMLEVFEACIDAPKTSNVELVKWAGNLRQSITNLRALRGSA